MGLERRARGVAMLGLPPHRPRLGLVGFAFAAAYALGSVLGRWEAAAIAGLVETAIGAALALAFGIAIPRLVQSVGDRDRLEA